MPRSLVDIGRLTDLAYVNDGGDHIAIGGMTTHQAVQQSSLLVAEAPLLAHVAEAGWETPSSASRHTRWIAGPRRSGVRSTGRGTG
ncbi:MAG: FAD binding domain-containing protein [Acidimicrobiales bacterium]